MQFQTGIGLSLIKHRAIGRARAVRAARWNWDRVWNMKWDTRKGKELQSNHGHTTLLCTALNSVPRTTDSKSENLYPKPENVPSLQQREQLDGIEIGFGIWNEINAKGKSFNPITDTRLHCAPHWILLHEQGTPNPKTYTQNQNMSHQIWKALLNTKLAGSTIILENLPISISCERSKIFSFALLSVIF